MSAERQHRRTRVLARANRRGQPYPNVPHGGLRGAGAPGGGDRLRADALAARPELSAAGDGERDRQCRRIRGRPLAGRRKTGARPLSHRRADLGGCESRLDERAADRALADRSRALGVATLLLGDGEQLVGVRWARGFRPATLYWAPFKDGVCLASEPLDGGRWKAVPAGQLAIARAGQDLMFEALR